MKWLKLTLIALTISSSVYAFGTDGCTNNTAALLHLDGVNNATTSTDEGCKGTGNKILTFTGSTVIDTAQSKFGPSSANFNGNIQLSDDPDWDFGTGEFTFDFQIRSSAWAAAVLCDRNGGVDWQLYFTGTTLDFYLGNVLLISRAFAPSNNQWYHIVVERISGSLRIYVDGAAIGADVADATSVSSANVVFIGSDKNSLNKFAGWIDEFRISNVAMYKGTTYVVPTTPYCSGCEMVQVLG